MALGACLTCGSQVRYWRSDKEVMLVTDLDAHPDGRVTEVVIPKLRWTEIRSHLLEPGETTERKRYRLHGCWARKPGLA